MGSPLPVGDGDGHAARADGLRALPPVRRRRASCGALGISEVLEWAEEVLWRIDRAAFFEKFREEHAVQYFYEPFLEAFDPQLRKELGVWYTPDEVVQATWSPASTRSLREELGIADGLADESVVVLDPCCGTGAYLVEVLRKIDETLQAKGADALTRQDVKRAAMNRVIGFEIMPAPFVVAHLQMGILLAELGVPLRDADERAAIYLTNALTGWGDGDGRAAEGQARGRGPDALDAAVPRVRRGARRGRPRQARRADPRGDREPAVQRVRGHGGRRGARACRGVRTTG